MCGLLVINSYFPPCNCYVGASPGIQPSIKKSLLLCTLVQLYMAQSSFGGFMLRLHYCPKIDAQWFIAFANSRQSSFLAFSVGQNFNERVLRVGRKSLSKLDMNVTAASMNSPRASTPSRFFCRVPGNIEDHGGHSNKVDKVGALCFWHESVFGLWKRRWRRQAM